MKRAVGIIRVSEQGDREDANFMSPDAQRTKLDRYCDSENLHLVRVYEEIDVSGGTPLAKRTKGLLPSVEAVESGQANVIVVAYFDRLVRSLKVQQEVIERVEQANGDIFTLDLGKVTNGNAATRLSNNMMGSVFEFIREQGAEKSREGQMKAIEKGHWPVILIPGLRRVGDNVELDPDTCDAVTQAFKLRDHGATIEAVRAHLREHGIERTLHGVQSLLRSHQAIGVIRYSDQVGTVPALIDKDTWERVQEKVISRGRQPKSDRLLARLGVLRCGTCGAKLSIGHQRQRGRDYPFYRCPNSDCARRMAIGAEIVEARVVREVKEYLADAKGRASSAVDVMEAESARKRAQEAYDRALRITLMSDAESEEEAQKLLRELREARDEARKRHEDLLRRHDVEIRAVTVADWDDLSPEEKRKLIPVAIDRVLVVPGRGEERLRVCRAGVEVKFAPIVVQV